MYIYIYIYDIKIVSKKNLEIFAIEVVRAKFHASVPKCTRLTNASRTTKNGRCPLRLP